MRNIISPCMPAIIRKSTTSLQQRTLGSWWVIQLCAAEKGQAWWCHFISWPGSVGFEMALTRQCGNPRCWQLSVVTTPHHVAGVPWVEELEGGDESDLVGSLGYIIFHRKWFFFSLGLAETSMIFKVLFKSNYVQEIVPGDSRPQEYHMSHHSNYTHSWA